MAHRDKSQGFAFAYVDVKKLLEQKGEMIDLESQAPSAPKESKVVNFNKDVQPPVVSTSVPDAPRERAVAIHQIRENLDRLQSLHHKLHAMLDELDQITDRDKKRR